MSPSCGAVDRGCFVLCFVRDDAAPDDVEEDRLAPAITRAREDDGCGDSHRRVGVGGERGGSVEHAGRHRPRRAE